jgi:hypothetical protein
MLTVRQWIFITFGIIGIIAFGVSILTSLFDVQGNIFLFYATGLLAFACAFIILWTISPENTQRSRFPAPTQATKLGICFFLSGSVAQASMLVLKSVALLLLVISFLLYIVGVSLMFQASRRQTK